MFAACTYEEIELRERQIENKEIVVLLFSRPSESEILKEFEYIHYNSSMYCSIYAIGYTNDPYKDDTFKKIDVSMKQDWYFSNKVFVEFKEKLQERIQWKYSGEVEVLILQNNPGNNNVLNFTHYIAIDVKKGIKDGYIDSFQRFMESLIRSAKSEVTAKEAIGKVANDRIKLKDILFDTIDECKKVPTPVKKIVKNRLFYRTAKSYSK